jgi:hypothetical protein
MVPIWLVSQFRGVLSFLKGKWLLPLLIIGCLGLFGLWARSCGHEQGFIEGQADSDINAAKWQLKYEQLLAAKTSTTTTTSRSVIAQPTIRISQIEAKQIRTADIQTTIDSVRQVAEQAGFKQGIGAYESLKQDYNRIAPPLRVDHAIDQGKIYGWFRPLLRDYDLYLEPPPQVIDSVRIDTETLRIAEKTFWQHLVDYLSWFLSGIGVYHLISLLF